VPTAGSYPDGITGGPDGAVWFTEYFSGKIGRISSAGIIQEYALPAAGQSPVTISSASDGALWFTEGASSIGRITTTGVITEYSVPTIGATPDGITVGPDGAIWFTESSAGKIGRAPACGLGFSTSFANSTLTMNFNLGIDTPATFAIHLRDASGPFGEPFLKAIPAVVPPQAFTMTWSSFPNLGKVTVEPSLATQPGGAGLGLCSEWATVNMAQ